MNEVKVRMFVEVVQVIFWNKEITEENIKRDTYLETYIQAPLIKYNLKKGMQN